MMKEIYKRFTSLLHNIYIYNYLIINILYIYYIVFVNCKSCKRKKLIKSFFTKTDSKGFKTAFTIYNLQNLTSSFYKFGVL